MKKQKVTLPGLRIKSVTISTSKQIKTKSQKNDGGYTWVG